MVSFDFKMLRIQWRFGNITGYSSILYNYIINMINNPDIPQIKIASLNINGLNKENKQQYLHKFVNNNICH